MNRKHIVTFVLVILLLLVGIIGILFYSNKEEKSLVTEPSRYNASEEIAIATSLLKQGEKASLIQEQKTLKKTYYLAIQGMSDMETNQKVIDLLEQYDYKATFFLPGILAVEDSRMIERVNQGEFEIGSNSLQASPHMEKFTQQELIEDFASTNKILTQLTSVQRPILQCNATEYSVALREAAYASGNDKILISKHFLNYQSFHTYGQVEDYIANLDRGSILTYKLSGSLDTLEYNKEEESISENQIDGDDDIGQNKISNNVEIKSEQERTVEVLGWILEAMKVNKFETEYISSIPSTSDFNKTPQYESVKNQNQGEKALVYYKIPTDTNYVSYIFRDISDEKGLNFVLETINKSSSKATFFVTAHELEDYPERIQKILDAGCTIENGGLDQKTLAKDSFAQIYEEILICRDKLKEFGIQSQFFMPAGGIYNDTVLEAASAAGYHVVTYNRNPIINNKTSGISVIQDDFDQKLSAGDIIFFNLSNTNSLKGLQEVAQTTESLKKQVVTLNALYTNMGNDSEVRLNAVEIPQLLSKNELLNIKELGKGLVAREHSDVLTTERAFSFIFSGIRDEDTVKGVLNSLKSMEYQGTFFVSYREMMVYPDLVKSIIDGGNEIGIAVYPEDSDTFESICQEINAMQLELLNKYQKKVIFAQIPYTKTKETDIVKQAKQAIYAMDLVLVTGDMSIIQSEYKDFKSAQEYVKTLLEQSYIQVKRGQIISVRLDFLRHSEIAGKILETVKSDIIDPIAYYDADLQQSMWPYRGITLKALYYNLADKGEALYKLNSLEDVTLPVAEGKRNLTDNNELMSILTQRYIGNIFIDSTINLPGFSEDEVLKLDKTGLGSQNTADNHVFLSFDDWGTDRSINHLLYVLDKHQIKANFYIISKNVKDNPNLLRAIAEAGHEVGSHTHSHFLLSNSTVSGNEVSYTTLTHEQCLELRRDAILSYEELYQVIGDVTYQGFPTLVPIFRPPTLAVSKEGLKQIFEVGYDLSVSGDYSTGDYEFTGETGKGPEELLDRLSKGNQTGGRLLQIVNQSNVVMHMSESGASTAQAIDLWMKLNAKQKFQFDMPIYRYRSKTNQ